MCKLFFCNKKPILFYDDNLVHEAEGQRGYGHTRVFSCSVSAAKKRKKNSQADGDYEADHDHTQRFFCRCGAFARSFAAGLKTNVPGTIFGAVFPA